LASSIPRAPVIPLPTIVDRARKLAKAFRVTNGRGFRLADVDPGDTLRFTSEDKPRAKQALAIGVAGLTELQDMLYAQDRWAVLLVFQAMDAAGKDGAIKHVMSGVNPQGCQVYSFKAPSSEDLDHDLNVEHVLHSVLDHVRADPGLRVVVCDLSSSPLVDLAGARMLASLRDELTKRGISLQLAEASSEVRTLLRADGRDHAMAGTARVPLADVVESLPCDAGRRTTAPVR
jgi:ABC-type transporter Mla MlaB component